MATTLNAIIYCSKASGPFSAAKLNKLTHSAQAFNYETNITGFLYYDGGYFFQYIEGPAGELAYLFTNISDDERHQITHHFLQPSIESRLFKSWSMRLISAQELVAAQLEHRLVETMQRSNAFDQGDSAQTEVLSLVAKLSELSHGY